MKIIGAGFGRTGTLSLKVALEKLGYGPCYHMLEVFKHPGHIRIWQAAADGQTVDWDALFAGYQAVLDYPASGFYKELMAAYPEARVILTVRDPSRWYESTYETIYQGAALPGWLMALIPPLRGFSRMVRATVWDRLFEGKFGDRTHALEVFDRHIEEVQRVIPPERLLTYRVSEGWEPLCVFLGTPVPDGPFPHVNDRKTTKRLFLLARVIAVALVLAVLALILQGIL